MSGPGEPFREGELRNNNQQTDGDANANEIRTEDGRIMAESGTMTETVQQDKVIIWGTDSQCDDPDLAEFEMLECQELEAYVVEDGKDFVGVAERKRRQDPNTSRSKGSADHVTDNKSRGERKTILHEAGEQDTNASQKSESRELSKAELSSETDVFVSCLSTISSMDTAMDTTVRSQTTDSWHIASGPYSTISEDLTLTTDNVPERGKVSQRADHHPLPSGENTIHGIDVDMNLNSTVQSEDLVSEAQLSNEVFMCKDAFDEHRKNNNQINKAGNAILEGEFDKRRSTEHKGIPTTKTAHKQSNIKMDKSTQADEAPDVKFSPSITGTKGNQSSFESKAMKKQGSFDNSLKKQYPPEWSYKKQPSFETTLKKQPSFENTFNKQGSFENTVPSSSSSLERRKPWGSPSRPATPTSPKITFGSPKRRLPGSPAKVQSIRSLSFERSDSPQRGLGPTVRPPGKTGLSSCIPKPVSSQQKEPEPRRSSPPQKPKNVRPKIITYVRKNPQAKPQGTEFPIEGSTLPQRISSYSSPPAQKDAKVGTQPKSSPVLCSSNLLFDKYRQEMPKSGYHPPGMASTGVKPPGNTAPQRLSGKSGSFHEDIPEKTLQENVSQDGCSVYRSPRALRPQLGLGAVTRQPAAKTRGQMGQRSAPVPGQSAQPAGASNQGNQDPAGDQKRSGLRPPGFSALPNSRLATLGFVRSSSASSVSSNQSNDSNQSDPCRPSEHTNSGGLGCFGWLLVLISLLFVTATFPITLFMCVKIVKEYERAVIFRLGRITDRKPKGPGLFFVLPCTDTFVKVDLRTVSFDIPPQEILTRDSVTVSVDGVVYFRIHCPISSVANVSNAHSSTRLLAQTTLRNVLGTKNLAELLSDREGISLSMQESLDDATDPWGIKVERVEIKDVKLPQQLQRAMAAEAEASREARAKIISAEGEMNASRALKEASLIIAESPSGLQLRYLQTLNTIAAERNSTIIFPVPIDMLQNFMKK
ncbi:uncharacterized protein [Notothenia coriiceps]|uniref:Band 7 domain-containing protein n=1 Tax=Notothenia coriiceps TaxID=8208 RepID=A0A6I9NUD9_9TELE|nr:PREDICTED: uncharacterized protein LOC104954322 [Notothenia coriiceps]